MPTELDLSCEPEPGRLVSCYETLLKIARTHAAEQLEPLSASLSKIITELSRNQEIASSDTLGPSLKIDRVEISARRDKPSGWICLDVFGGLTKQ